MVTKTATKPFNPFKDKRSDFDAISSDINSKNSMKDIETIIEEKRKNIFDILSYSRANWNDKDDETSLKKMKDALDDKKWKLETGLWNVTNLDYSNNTDLVKYCKSILDSEDPSKEDKTLANECRLLLSDLQNIYTKWARKEKLFSGKKDPADGTLKDLTDPDSFKSIVESWDITSLETNIDTFISKVFSSKDNSFSITKSKLYSKEQAEVTARIAIFLHCIQKALNEWRISDTTEVKNIINELKNTQIPKIRWIYNLKKEKEAVDAEYDTLVDIKKNDITDIDWTDTTTSIDLTDSFESKSTDKAKWIDFYNLNKDDIKVTINGTDYTKNDIILKDSSWEKLEFNTQMTTSSWDYSVYLKIGWNEVKVWTLCIDYTNTTKASFVLTKSPNMVTDLNALGITVTWDIDVNIPVMAVKKVKPTTHTWQVSLTRNIKAKIKSGIVPPPPPPVTIDDLEIDAVVSDMWPDVLKEKVALDIEEELKKEYKEINKWNVFKRAYFFLSRWKIRNKRVKKKLNEMSWKAFTWDSVIDNQTWNAADRHQLEKETGFNSDIKNIDEHNPVVYQSPQINDLCKRYLEWSVTDNQFQTDFNTIIESDTSLKDELEKANINHMWTNILLRMKQQLAWKTMINVIKTNLDSYVSSWASSYIDNINVAIKDYIKTFQDNTDRKHWWINKNLLTIYNDYLWDKTNTLKLNELQNFLMHEQAVMSLTASNILIKLDIIKWWKSAYQINNKEREKSWKYKLWHWMDKHPVRTSVGTVWASIWLWLATWWLWAVVWAAVTTAWFASIVWTTNAVKKWTHHTKEQNTHEKNLVTDNNQEKNRIKNREDMKNNNWWWTWKHYKAKRQLQLYDETTQSDIKISSIISNDINNSVSSLVWNLTPTQKAAFKNQLRGSLIEWWARLKYYKEIWHNFLASNQKTKTEEDMNQLSKALLLWISTLWDTDFSDIESYSATNSIWRTITFNDVYDNIKDNFKNSDKEFRKRRRNLSLKYWISTGLASAWTALGMQWITGTWVFAKWTNPVSPYYNSNSVSDNFDLWKHQLLDTWTQNNIYNWTKSTLTWAPNWSTLNIHYWWGTDATWFLPWKTPNATNLASKVSEVTSNINGMSWLTSADKATFIREVSSLWWGSWTNWYLQNMRHAEFLEQAARALSDSGQSGKVAVSLVHDTWLDVVWTHVHDVGERVVNWFVEVTKAGAPGKPPVKWWRWLMWAPFFFNTFKDKQEP